MTSRVWITSALPVMSLTTSDSGLRTFRPERHWCGRYRDEDRMFVHPQESLENHKADILMPEGGQPG